VSIHQRGKVYWLKRRVPARYSGIETRKEVWRSLKTDSPAVAAQKAEAVWNELIEGWEARLAGRSAEAEERFAAARDLAAARGVRFLSARAVAELPIGQVLERVEAVAPAAAPDQPDSIEAAAILGGAGEAPITVSRALELYWTMTRDQVLDKSDDQVRRWKNPRKKAIRNFIDVVGDKPIAAITADDMGDFRNAWMERIEAEGLTPNSGNKDLTHLGAVLKTVNARKRLGIDLPLAGFSFKQGDSAPRPPFSDDWIRDRVLAPGALDGLNPEARAIMLGMVNTGYRPGEAAGLMPEDIVLDDDVPHIRIRGNAARSIKTGPSRRDLPLVGVSLAAFKEFPDGFPRYRKSSAGLSATINKYLRENGLAETNRHTLYSLRHSFEDRLLRARVDERVRRDVLGHALGRERYGEGGGPAFLLGEIQRAAL
jgi:integrase